VTVDCGISSAAEVELLAEKGVRVVITDHHEPGAGLPLGVPVANPKLDASGGASCDLAGAGVALKLVSAVGARLGQPTVWRELTDLPRWHRRGHRAAVFREQSARRRWRGAYACGAARVGRRAARGRRPTADALSSDGVAFALAPRLNAAGAWPIRSSHSTSS